MFWIVLAHFNFNIFGMFIYVASSPDPFLGPQKSTFNLARFSLLSRKTAEAAPSLQQNLGTLAFHFQNKKVDPGWVFPLQKWKGWDLYNPQKGNYEGCIQGG